MEQTPSHSEAVIPAAEVQEILPATCLTCHQAVLPEYYFCPNCGNKLTEAPLPITLIAQTQLYLFSIILPLICFITINKWKGIKYLTSKDKEAHIIGIIACILLIISTVFTFWFTYISLQKLVTISTEGVSQNIDAY